MFNNSHITSIHNLILFAELDQLTGIAAILRFPMPELEDESDGDESEDD